MSYLLDTDTLVAFLRGVPAVVNRVLAQSPSTLATSSVNLAELHYGASKSLRSVERTAELRQLEGRLAVLPFNRDAAPIFGELKASLERAGLRLEDADLFIASVALEGGLVLVTHNTAHFSRVAGLRLEDWL